jgi:hypothetical protein
MYGSLLKAYQFNLRDHYRVALLTAGSRPNKLQSANA